MKVSSEVLAATLQMVSPGLTTKELVEQSSCVVFKGGRVCTFNEEIFCSAPSPIGDFEGAIVAQPVIDLMASLGKLEVDIDTDPEKKKFRIRVAGRIRSKINMQAEVLLPIDSVEPPAEDTWTALPVDFAEAVALVSACASQNKREFLYSCVHLMPGHIEACDRFQIGRYPLNLTLSDFEQGVLVRASSIARIAAYGMAEMAETPSWLHFRRADGLVLACRKFNDQYGNLDKHVDREGAVEIVLPGSLEEVCKRGEIFSRTNAAANFVTVDLFPSYMVVSTTGPFGDFEERKDVAYKGDPMRFLISPLLLVTISQKSVNCCVTPKKLFVNTDKFFYCTCTTDPSKTAPKKDAEAASVT